MNYTWNWGVLLQEPYWHWLQQGFGLTVAISTIAWGIALMIGTLVGLMHTATNGALRCVSSVYITVFRNIPLLLQMFLWFFVVPELLPQVWGHWLKRGMPYPEIVTAVVALGLFTAARVAVQVSAGVRTVPIGQSMAGRAAGMSQAQIYRFILLPQAFRIIIPPMTSEFLTVFKNSSIALTIGVYELTAQIQQIQSYTYQGFEAYTAATAAYVSIALLLTMLMRIVERRTALPGTLGH
jgi:glutamate/aspartate transport system permease protein